MIFFFSSLVTARTSVPFPAVTVCNNNRIHCTMLVNKVLELKKEVSVREKTCSKCL